VKRREKNRKSSTTFTLTINTVFFIITRQGICRSAASVQAALKSARRKTQLFLCFVPHDTSVHTTSIRVHFSVAHIRLVANRGRRRRSRPISVTALFRCFMMSVRVVRCDAVH